MAVNLMIKLKFFIIEGSVVNLFQRKSSLVSCVKLIMLSGNVESGFFT